MATPTVAGHFTFANPRELAGMEESVRNTPGVILLEIPTISLQDVNGTIYFTGDKKALQAALVKQGVIVTDPGGDKPWVLSVR